MKYCSNALLELADDAAAGLQCENDVECTQFIVCITGLMYAVC